MMGIGLIGLLLPTASAETADPKIERWSVWNALYRLKIVPMLLKSWST